MSFPYIVVGRYTLLITIAKIQKKKILNENDIHSDSKIGQNIWKVISGHLFV